MSIGIVSRKNTHKLKIHMKKSFTHSFSNSEIETNNKFDIVFNFPVYRNRPCRMTLNLEFRIGKQTIPSQRSPFLCRESPLGKIWRNTTIIQGGKSAHITGCIFWLCIFSTEDSLYDKKWRFGILFPGCCSNCCQLFSQVLYTESRSVWCFIST